MKRNLFFILVFLGAVVCPQTAWANAGTPLVWISMFHLAIGNAIIGVLEGLLLVRSYSFPEKKTVVVMIIANYFSAWLGGLFLHGAVVESLPLDLNNGWRWFWILVAGTYVITVILEWPFIAWIFRGTKSWLRQSIRACLLVQGASYIGLFTCYWLASTASLYTETKIVPASELSLPDSVIVYYISPNNGNVYRRPLGKGTSEKVYALHATNINDRLVICPGKLDTNRWDLLALIETGIGSTGSLFPLETNLLFEATSHSRSSNSDQRGTWFNFGQADTLGNTTNSNWKFWTGFWPYNGLTALKKTPQEQRKFAYETPFGAWVIRNAIQISSEKVIFQLGNDQICALDPESRKISLLWHGRGPIAVIAKNSRQ